MMSGWGWSPQPAVGQKNVHFSLIHGFEERRGGEEAGVKFAHNDLAHCTHRTEPPPNSLKVGVQGDAELGSSSKCQEGSVQ